MTIRERLRNLNRASLPVDSAEGLPHGAVLTLDSIEDHYQIVDRVYNPTYGEAVIVTEKGRRVKGREAARKLTAHPVTATSLGGEIGAARTKWRSLLGNEEYNTALAGIDGILKFDEMRRQDVAVRTSLRLAKTPVLAARWGIEPADRDNESSKMHARFIEWALFDAMTISWEQILMEALLMMDFGYYMFELVFTIKEFEGQPKVCWQKWAPRHPIDVASEGWEYDDHGGPVGVWMQNFEGEQDVFIPIEKLVVFTYDREANNMEGISLLRSSYKHWFYKDNLYRIDAIAKERHGIGVPVIKLPPGFTASDKTIADELGRNLRTNEQAHVVLPPFWELMFAKIEGQVTNPIESIEHHNKEIVKNVFGQWLDTGAAASKEQEIDIYMKALRFTADLIRGIVNKHAIVQLMNFNFPGVTDYPTLRARRIGEANELRTLSFAARNFIGAGLVIPDDKLEEWVRDELDMPQADKATQRLPEERPQGTGGTPQAPKVGPPRQSPPSAGSNANRGGAS